MNNLCRKVFQYSLLSYFAITMYTRFVDGSGFDIFFRIFYSLPLEFNDGRNSVQFQTYFLSQAQTAEFLNTNPDNCDRFKQGTDHPQYLILRYKDTCGRNFGDLKVYFPHFQHPLIVHINPTSRMGEPVNLVLPLPYQCEKSPCEVNLHWKYFW